MTPSRGTSLAADRALRENAAMGAKRAKQTLAEIMEELKAEPPKPEPVLSAGAVDYEGRLHDGAGARLTLTQEDLSPEEAQRLVRTATAVASDACGCGGNSGCRITWLTADQLTTLRRSRPPVLDRRRGQVAWIEAWEGETGVLLYLHGNVEWAGLFY
jgi:hypothetical protein